MDRERSAHLFRRVRRAAGWLRIALVFSAPLLIGSVHPAVIATQSVLCVVALLGTIVPGHPSSTWSRRLAIPWTSLVLLMAALFGMLQLVPIPPSLARLLSPSTDAWWQNAAALAEVAVPAWHPLSVDPAATLLTVLRALGLAALVAAIAIACRRRGLRAVRGVLWAIAASGAVSVAAGLLRALLNDSRLMLLYTPTSGPLMPEVFLGTFVHPNHQAAFLGLCSLVAISLAFREPNLLKKSAALALCLASSVALALTFSLSAVVAFSIGFLLMSALSAPIVRVQKVSNFTVVGTFLLPILVMVATWAAMHGTYDLAKQFDDGLIRDVRELQMKAEASRLGAPAWTDEASPPLAALLEMATRAPWSGFGAGTFEAAFPAFNERSPDRTFPHAANSLLGVLIAFGFVMGGMVLVLLAWSILRVAPGALTSTSMTGALAATLALGLNDLTGFALTTNGLAIPAAALLGMLSAGVHDKADHTTLSRAQGLPVTRRILLASAGIMLVLSGVFAAAPLGPDLRTDTRTLHKAFASRADFLDTAREVLIRHPASFLPPLATTRHLIKAADAPRVMPWMQAAQDRALHNPAVRQTLVGAALVTGDFDGARLAFADVRHLPGDLVNETLADVYGNPAIRDRIILLAPAPDPDGATTLEIARFLRERGDRPLRLALLQRAFDAMSHDPRFGWLLGSQQLATGNVQHADRVAVQMIATHPKAWEGYDLLGRCLAAQGRIVEAFHALLEATMRHGSDVAPFFHLVELMLAAPQLGDPTPHMDRLDRQCISTPERLRATLLRSRFYERESRYSAAIRSLEEAVAMVDDPALIQVRLARLQALSNDLPAAIRTLRTVLSRNPDQSEAKTELDRLLGRLVPQKNREP